VAPTASQPVKHKTSVGNLSIVRVTLQMKQGRRHTRATPVRRVANRQDWRSWRLKVQEAGPEEDLTQ
jgi:hypothetical protein